MWNSSWFLVGNGGMGFGTTIGDLKGAAVFGSERQQYGDQLHSACHVGA